MKSAAAGILAIGLAACGGRAAVETDSVLLVDAPPGSGIDLGRAEVRTARAVREATLHGGRLTVRLAGTGEAVEISAPGACRVEIQATGAGPGGVARLTLVPLLGLDTPTVDVGFDRTVEIVVRPGCPEAAAGEIEWKQVSGTPLPELAPRARGFQARLRTVSLVSALGHEPPWGVVPLSPRTRGEAELELTWKGPDGARFRRTFRVAAAARSHGLPNVAVGATVHLGGTGWTLKRAPHGATAGLEPSPHETTFLPDLPGRWELEDAEGRGLRIMTSRYDETPLDCGRSRCHGAVSAVVRSSPMTTILQRGLDGPFPGDRYPACALGCHAAGEPGQDDGGFESVLTRLGWSPEDLVRSGYHALPPALRRQAGVTCLGCHGPGAIPEPSARHDVLRTDVCAYCHDAPPRYGHVAAWQTSSMARSDQDPEARSNPACARCHTTWGALDRPDREPPAHAAPAGITCVACHAVHPAGGGDARSPGRCEEALRREAPVPALLTGSVKPGDPSRVCVTCHSPDPLDPFPSATAAALLHGRGGLSPADGKALDGAARALGERGCLECHVHGPDGLGKGTNHGFRALRDSGTSDPTIARRALSLGERLGIVLRGGGRPLHAKPPRIDTSTPRGRAAWNVALVLGDESADAHNAAYAHQLLDSAARTLGETVQP